MAGAPVGEVSYVFPSPIDHKPTPKVGLYTKVGARSPRAPRLYPEAAAPALSLDLSATDKLSGPGAKSELSLPKQLACEPRIPSH